MSESREFVVLMGQRNIPVEGGGGVSLSGDRNWVWFTSLDGATQRLVWFLLGGVNTQWISELGWVTAFDGTTKPCVEGGSDHPTGV